MSRQMPLPDSNGAPTDAVGAIQLRMRELGLTHKDLVPFIGTLPKVSEVLCRKRKLSLTMIQKLHRGLDIPAELLISSGTSQVTEASHDHTKYPLKEMQERGLFGPKVRTTWQLKDQSEALMTEFYRAHCLDVGQPMKLRAGLYQGGSRPMDHPALLVWQAIVLRKARNTVLKGKYQHGSITMDWMRGLARLSSLRLGPQLAQEYLANHGVALVFEPHFKKTYLDGAAMLDGDVPVIGLTLRHDRPDNFWFALFHELIHVQMHLSPDRPYMVDSLDDATRTNQEEIEADEGAREGLIPATEWEAAAVRRTYSTPDAMVLARHLQIHPAIVAGRVRNETGNWRLLSSVISSAGKVSEQLTS